MLATFECSQCAHELAAGDFSKRMLERAQKGAPSKCKSCVERAQAEAAASRQASATARVPSGVRVPAARGPAAGTSTPAPQFSAPATSATTPTPSPAPTSPLPLVPPPLPTSSAAADDDAERREAEHEALCAIYADVIEGEPAGPWRIAIDDVGCTLEVYLPLDYPSRSAPTPVLHSAVPLDEVRRATLVEELLALFEENEVVYTWVEHLRDSLRAACPAETSGGSDIGGCGAAANAVEQRLTDASMALALSLQEAEEVNAATEAAAVAADFTFTPATTRYGQRTRHFGSGSTDERHRVEIFSGPSFHPPKSGPSEEFQAHVARVHSMGNVQWALAQLLSDKRVARATHNMLAYRFVDERGVMVCERLRVNTV